MTQSLRYLHLPRQIRQLPKFQPGPVEGLYFQLHPWLNWLLPVGETSSGWQNTAATLTIRVIQNGQSVPLWNAPLAGVCAHPEFLFPKSARIFPLGSHSTA
jgi:hypothetical protein